jgi:hypothetical protein
VLLDIRLQLCQRAAHRGNIGFENLYRDHRYLVVFRLNASAVRMTKELSAH